MKQQNSVLLKDEYRFALPECGNLLVQMDSTTRQALENALIALQEYPQAKVPLLVRPKRDDLLPADAPRSEMLVFLDDKGKPSAMLKVSCKSGEATTESVPLLQG